MAKKKMTFDEIMDLAELYGVKDNVLFVSAAQRYAGQIQVIENMQEHLKGGLMLATTGSMGQQKVEAHPLVAQMPKYNDTANKTLSVMLDIITKLGQKTEAKSALSELMDE